MRAAKKVSDLIVGFLEEKGIKYAFGIICADNAHIFDSISSKGYKYFAESK